MEQKYIIYGVAGIAGLILIVFIGSRLVSDSEPVKPAQQPATTTQVVVKETKVIVKETSQKSQKKSSKKSSQKNEEEETDDNDDQDKKSNSLGMKGKKIKTKFEISKTALNKFLDESGDFYSELEEKFDDLVEERENLKTRLDEEKENKNSMTKEEKEDEKERKAKINTTFIAYKIVKENAKDPEKVNEKFDKFVSNLEEIFTNETVELSEDNIFKKMMADFIEERQEEIDEYKDKHNKDPAYDPEDEKNKIAEAEISGIPLEYVDVQFIEKFIKFIKGNSQRMQKYYQEINDKLLKNIKIKETSFESVSKSVQLFNKMNLFNSQLEGVFGNTDYNCMGFYNQKGKIVILSLFEFDNLGKTGLKMENFLDKFRTTKNVQETLEIIIEEENSVVGLIKQLKSLQDKNLYIKEMKLDKFVFLPNPKELEGKVYLSTPIYIGADIISLNNDTDFDKENLKINRIHEDDVEKLKEKNIKDFKQMLLQTFQESFPQDHMYYSQESNLSAAIDFIKNQFSNKIKKEETYKDKRKFTAELVKAQQQVYDDYNSYLIVEQLARSSRFANTSAVFIGYEIDEETPFKEILEKFGKGKGAKIGKVTINKVEKNYKYKVRRNKFVVVEKDLEYVEKLLKFLTIENDFDYEQGNESQNQEQDSKRQLATNLFSKYKLLQQTIQQIQY